MAFMKLGKITGRRIGTNRDGDASRVILQVELLEDDVKTVELFSQAGEDVNPADGCRAVVIDVASSYKVAIAVSDDLTPEVNAGEKEIYSTDNPATTKQARTLWDSAGNVVHNQGAESVVTYAALDLALQTLVTAINGAFATKADAAGANPALTLDISLSESPTVKVP
jgi:hypothetical protein